MAINAYMLALYEKHKPGGGKAVSFGYPSAHHDIKGDFKERMESDGFTVAVLDLFGEADIRFDLNQPNLLPRLADSFDLVINPGTIEHCFHPGNALVNSLRMMKVGGVILHLGPLNRPKHGLWEARPQMYEKFYAENGCEVLHLDTDKAARAHLYCVAQKHSEATLKLTYEAQYAAS